MIYFISSKIGSSAEAKPTRGSRYFISVPGFEAAALIIPSILFLSSIRFSPKICYCEIIYQRKVHHTGHCKSVSYTHLRAHETGRNLVCRLLLEKKKKTY